MSDIEKLKDLLGSWKVPYREVPEPEQSGTSIVVGWPLGLWGAWDNAAQSGGDSDRVTGYEGFHTVFCFSPDGEFAEMGAWE